MTLSCKQIWTFDSLLYEVQIPASVCNAFNIEQAGSSNLDSLRLTREFCEVPILPLLRELSRLLDDSRMVYGVRSTNIRVLPKIEASLRFT